MTFEPSQNSVLEFNPANSTNKVVLEQLKTVTEHKENLDPQKENLNWT